MHDNSLKIIINIEWILYYYIHLTNMAILVNRITNIA